MTTIATDGKTIVSDGYASGGYGRKLHDRVKIAVFDGNYYGFAGTMMPMQFWEEWLKTKEIKGMPTTTAVLEVDKSGKITVYDDEGITPNVIDTPFAAIGSGSQLAMGALEAGASAEQAVRIASLYDSLTNDNLTVFEINQ